MVIKGKLMAAVADPMQYITYVFEILDENLIENTKYIMCVKFPNWDTPTIEIGEIGFVHFEIIKAGEDKWWDHKTQRYVSYNYDMTQFIKFVPEPKPEDVHKYIM